MCAKLGGFAMIALATNGARDSGSGSMHDFQQPCNISAIILRFLLISPSFSVFMLGIRPGFRTIYCEVSSGTPLVVALTYSHEIGRIATYGIELEICS